jgi:Uncharacterized protein conserved in bacteria
MEAEMRIHIGDVVRHFKRETVTAEQLEFDENLYLYRVLNFAKHTETGETFVIYESLYNGKAIGCNVHYGDVFARPMDMFMSEVDHDIECEYRFETVEEDHQCLWCGSKDIEHLNELSVKSITGSDNTSFVMCSTCVGLMMHGFLDKKYDKG